MKITEQDWDGCTVDATIGPAEYNHLRLRREYGGRDRADYWVVERRDPLPDDDGDDVWTWVKVAEFACYSSYQVGGDPPQ